MNIEQRMKEIEETNQKLYEAAELVDKQNDELLKVSKELEKEHKRIIKINKDLQSEVERYKSLWEANAAESEEIIAELKTKDEWQPIETCPEEKYVFVWGKSENNPGFGKRYEAYKKDDRFLGYSISTLNIYEDMIYFTHWKPLPKPPEQNH